MSLLREDVLVKSLTQVSLQRLRNLKMDMDKLARDSRIKSEDAFWSLLELHNIRLDERTRREFGQIIIDNRGVNVEIALRHLKRAQRQTGRDSVEVLPKEPQNPKPDHTRLAPAATPTVPTFKPVLSSEKRNYKLDKFRLKAKGLGKLSAALKDKNTQPTRPKPESKPERKPEHENVSPKKSPSKEEAPVKDESEKESSDEKLKSSSGSSKTSKPDENPNNSSSPKLLQILLREETLPSAAETATSKQTSKNPDCNDNNMDESNTSPTSVTSLLQKSGKNPDDQAVSDNANENAQRKKNKTTSDEKGLSEPEQIPTKETGTSPDDVKMHSKTQPTEQQVSPEGTDETKDEPDENNCAESLGEYKNTKHSQSDDNIKDTDTDDKSQGAEVPSLDEQHASIIAKKEHDSEAEACTTLNGNGDGEPEENDLKYDSDIVDKPKKDLQTKEDTSARTDRKIEGDDKTITGDVGITSEKLEEATVLGGMENGDNADPKSQKAAQGPVNTDLSISESYVKSRSTINNTQADEIDEQQAKTADKQTDPAKDEDANGEENKDSTQSSEEVGHIGDNETKPNDDEQTIKFQEDNNPQPAPNASEDLEGCNDSSRHLYRADSHSITTLSSDNESQSDEAYERSSDLSKFSEHFQNWKAQNEVGLAVQWVYGCSTAYPQSMRINNNGEVVYFSGCVAIVYNHVRKSQRHYLEHSGFITGIAVHPSEARIASAQLGTSKQASSTTDISSSVGFGQTHIRVWNCDTMETITVIGIGILRRPVYKLQFLDYQDYFVTIENDESCTMTLWEGGCRVTSVETVFHDISLASFVKPKAEAKRPKTSAMQKTGTSSPTRPRADTVVGLKGFPPANNGPRCIGAIHTGEGRFVTAGKRQINFWRLLDEYDNEYVQGESDGAQLSLPIMGHFGSNFFKAEFLSCCCYTGRFLDGSMLTGDSNGTLLLWDESAKTPVRGFAHAHECHLSSICVSESGHIFTSGARDKLVKAFVCRKSKLECCGKLKIPSEFGSATCIAVNKSTLFVATEKHAILAACLNFDQPTTTSKAKLLHKRSQSTQSFGKVSKVSSVDENVVERTTSSVIVSWEDQEITRGWVYRGKCVAALKPLKQKKRKLRGTESLEEYRNMLSSAVPSMEVDPPVRQLPKSAGVRRKFPENSPTQAWKSRQEKYNNIGGDKLQFSNLYPRLRAHERILLREKARNEDPSKYDDNNMQQNFVRGQDLFYLDGEKKERVTEFFVTASDDGWIHIYSAGEQTVIGRCKVPELNAVTCLDTSARRQFVAVGNLNGKLTLARINRTAFELFPPTNFHCTTEGKSAINQVKFSPSGCKLLVSVGCDIAICHVTRSQVAEIARCIGHRSHLISGLDWTRKKHKDSYFIRSCGTRSKMELKVWNAKTTLEATFKDDQDERHWASHTCVLNFNSKGQWTQFNDSSYTAHSVQISSWKSSKHSSSGLFCVGDVEGVITMGAFPCLDTTTTRTYRAHTTSVTSIVGLSNKQQILTTADGDPSVVQWKICKA